MSETWGRRVVDTVGRSIQVSADGFPEFKHAGVSVDWSVVTAVAGADVTYLDGITVKVGEKALRYGQVLSQITASGKFGPHDPAAVDGRQNIGAAFIGSTYIVNETIREDMPASEHPPVLEGGLVYLSRIIQSGGGAASLAAGPTLANLKLTFPRLRLVTE